MRIDNLPWPEVKELFKAGTAIIPIGATEQHGPHLPLGADTLYAEYISERVGKNLKIPVLPPLCYSVSGFNFPYPTITLEPETLALVLKDICGSLKFFGVGKIFFFVGHGGENCSAVETAAYCIARDLDLKIRVVYPWTFLPDEMREKMKEDWHAGFLETSDMLFVREDLVKKDKLKESTVPEPMKFIVDYKKTESNGRMGVLGNPVGAKASIGAKNMGEIITKLTDHLSELLSDKS